MVTRTDNWICSWDLFTCTLSWRVGLQSTCMAADPRSSHMAVFTKDCCGKMTKYIIFEILWKDYFYVIGNLMFKFKICYFFILCVSSFSLFFFHSSFLNPFSLLILTVFIFEPKSSEPICWKRNINPAKVTCAAFIPRQTRHDSEEEWNVHSNLVFIDKDQVGRR